MSNDEDKSILNYFYPSCREKECGGILKFNINDENLSIDYECEKDKGHHGNRIDFKIFENYYLKEGKEKVFICSKCLSIIYTNKIYKCKECKKIYCQNCYNFDEHLSKDTNNLIIIDEIIKKINFDKICPKCRKDICFCFDCSQNICLYCSKYHNKHRTVGLTSLSQTHHSLNYLIEKIEAKSKINENLIYSLVNWEKYLKERIEALKQKLRDQITLLKKLTQAFNPFLDNVLYRFNFWNLFYSLSSINLNNIKKFNGSYGFEEQTKYIMKLLFPKNLSYEKKIGYVKYNKQQNLDEVILHKIDDKNYLVYEPYNHNKNLKLKTIDEEYSIEFKDKIYSITSSNDKNKIFICLLRQKKVKILNCNLRKLEIELSDEFILDSNYNDKNHFNKCMQISNEYLATSDNTKISIWSRVNNYLTNKGEFINVLNINLNTPILEMLYVNNEYFISCEHRNQSISFINIKKLEREKIIKDDKFLFDDPKNCLLSLDKYIVVNCPTGIVLIYIKTKEIVQFIDNQYKNKFICLNNNDSFYIISLFNNNVKEDIFLNKIRDCKYMDQRLFLWGTIEKLELIDGVFEETENYRQIYSPHNSSILRKSNFIHINDRFIYNMDENFIIEEIASTEVELSPFDNIAYKVLKKKN